MTSKDPNKRFFYWITGGRLAILASLLFSSYLLFSHLANISRLSLLLGGAFFLTIIYILWYRKKGLERSLVYTQIVLDVILVNLAVYWTGGINSPFVLLYPVVIIASCLLAKRKGGTVSALLSTISYAVLCWISRGQNSMADAAYTFFINMAAFNLTAVLGIILARRLQHTERELSVARLDLRRIEEIQRHLTNSIQSGLIAVSEKEKIIFFNQVALKILGQEIADGYGRSLKEVWPEAAEILEEFEVSGQGNRQEISYRYPHNSPKLVGISIFPLRNHQGQYLGYGMLFQDITEIKAREECLQRMDRLAALGEMAAGLAHEIRNPLASLSGAVQFLQETAQLGPEERRLLQIIERETGHLNDLTENFLLYARPEKIKIQDISLLEEIESVLALMSQRKGLCEADIEIDVPSDLRLRIDPAQFKQVLLNLFLNAYQALPDKGGKISIKGEKQENQLVLKFSDSGKGIRSDDLSRIFNPFFTTRPDGTGLGLSIVHRLVDEWNGDITVDSCVGKGSTFTLRLPVS